MQLNYNRYSVLEILDMISKEPGKNIKIQIIKDASVNQEFVDTLKAAYNPQVTYGITKYEIGNPLPEWSESQTLRHVYQTVLPRLIDRSLTGNRAKEKLNLLSDSLNVDRAEVLQRVLARDLRIGCNIASINKAIPGLINKYAVSLCSAFDKDAILKMPFPIIAQVKEDGMRCLLHVANRKVTAKTRNGKDLILPDFIVNQVLECDKFRNALPYVLDGEILVRIDGKLLTRAKANGVINKIIQGTATQEMKDGVEIVLWDFIYQDDFETGVHERSYNERFDTLKVYLIHFQPKNIRLSTSKICETYKDVEDFFQLTQDKKQEGVIVKNLQAPWKNKRTKDAIKIKDFKEAEFVITGIAEGAGRLTGKLGAFLVESSDGKIKVRIGTGYSDELREEYFTNEMIGKVITVQFMSVSNKDGQYSLEHNSFQGLRLDKDVANTFEEVQAS